MTHKAVPQRVMGDQGPFNVQVLENTTSRYAFWMCWVERKGSVWFACWRFGKIGTSGRSGGSKHHGSYAALAAAEAKYQKKRLKGDYVAVWNGGPPVHPSQPSKPKKSKVAMPLLMGKQEAVPLIHGYTSSQWKNVESTGNSKIMEGKFTGAAFPAPPVPDVTPDDLLDLIQFMD